MEPYNYKKALNRFKKTKLTPDHIQLKHTRAISRYIIKKNKTIAWQNFTSTINHKVNPSIIWNKINNIKGNKFNKLPDILHYNQEIVTTSNAAESFEHFFQNNNSDENYTPDFISLKTSTRDIPVTSSSHSNKHYNKDLDISELTSALNTCTSKSPGPDNLPYIFLKKLPPIGIKTLLQIYNLI